jgi:hypothetical protein
VEKIKLASGLILRQAMKWKQYFLIFQERLSQAECGNPGIADQADQHEKANQNRHSN